MDASPRYTHGYAESVLRSHRTRTAVNSAAHLIPLLDSGRTLLDVGSGAGTITVDLADLVAPARVTALETSTDAAALTRAEADRRGCRTVDVIVGDVLDLDLASASFDVVHAHQVLQHVTDPVAALREMIRVCRPGGVVAVRDADYGGFTWYPPNPGLDRWRELYGAAARANGGEPDAGRRLLSWAHAAGAHRVTASASTWCYADPAARHAWGSGWAERITDSAIARQLLDAGTTTAELRAVASAWSAWAAHPDG
ncbi:class I SAM-dependent methyltransferase [Nakamurella flavida]|uniref:Class I SAM-dependent methyltransferase n=1 Tax=Nakamurella flavida TaxID=363630 RepID=A0A939C0L5_9ACTN|nr:class I SAM-dependent methyltransferase [Nakamurella flavida]MBM9476848.1 class I SAM-dependent methyltransferase [Nakamurella flavida]MDP9778709.1 SAM-dependent methyltransferase [Nakamurella flavida]